MITHRQKDVMRIDFSISVFSRKLEEKYEMSKIDLRGDDYALATNAKGKLVGHYWIHLLFTIYFIPNAYRGCVL